jgi:predicted RNA-binding Zn-ribbon protein involved in translation (DUF1610 family)
VWGLWNQNVAISQIAEATEMLCWAAKWTDHPKIYYKSTYHDGKKRMLKELWKKLDEADAVIHFNGRKFDMRHINREFLESGMNPPSPYKQIDLLSAVKSRFYFPSNKLEYVCGALGIGHKLKHEGFDLWIGCMRDELSSWELMKQYNVNDVAITEMLYWKLLPWIPSIPNQAAYSQDEHVCPACGGKNLQRRGYAYTTQSRYHRYQCKDCGKWSRSSQHAKTIHTVSVADG